MQITKSLSGRFRFLVPLLLVMIGACAQASSFSFEENQSDGTLTLQENGTPVLTFVGDMTLKDGVPEKFRREGYFHPIYDLNGSSLTSDFPKDHYHHRGLWLSWPWMLYRGEKVQLWHPSPLRHRFDRILKQSVGKQQATLRLRNNWVLDETPIGSEVWQLTVHPRSGNRRIIDVSITIRAKTDVILLRGKQRKKKGYGGLTLRTAPSLVGGRLRTDKGTLEGDTVQKTFNWVDLSTDKRGITLFAHPSNPNSPPPWLIRNSYGGVLNPEWPGLKRYKLKPGDPLTLRYRLVVHDGSLSGTDLQNVFRGWTGATDQKDR